ncbi:MAG: Sec-independent protein translocase protein TatB [Lysobacteraceae bacterium]
MFDIGFSEIFMIGLVALLVLGPERLPKAARLAGMWVRKARSQWNSVKAELENEIADEELRRTLRESHAQLRDGLGEMQALVDPSRLPPAGSLPPPENGEAAQASNPGDAPDPLRDMMEMPTRLARTTDAELRDGESSGATHGSANTRALQWREPGKAFDD